MQQLHQAGPDHTSTNSQPQDANRKTLRSALGQSRKQAKGKSAMQPAAICASLPDAPADEESLQCTSDIMSRPMDTHSGASSSSCHSPPSAQQDFHEGLFRKSAPGLMGIFTPPHVRPGRAISSHMLNSQGASITQIDGRLDLEVMLAHKYNCPCPDASTLRVTERAPGIDDTSVLLESGGVNAQLCEAQRQEARDEDRFERFQAAKQAAQENPQEHVSLPCPPSSTRQDGKSAAKAAKKAARKQRKRLQQGSGVAFSQNCRLMGLLVPGLGGQHI